MIAYTLTRSPLCFESSYTPEVKFPMFSRFESVGTAETWSALMYNQYYSRDVICKYVTAAPPRVEVVFDQVTRSRLDKYISVPICLHLPSQGGARVPGVPPKSAPDPGSPDLNLR